MMMVRMVVVVDAFYRLHSQNRTFPFSAKIVRPFSIQLFALLLCVCFVRWSRHVPKPYLLLAFLVFTALVSYFSIRFRSLSISLFRLLFS